MEEEWLYNGLDCCITLEVLEALLPQLSARTKKTYEFSLALQAPILEMVQRGIRVDTVRRSELVREFREDIAVLEEQLYSIVFDGIGYPDFKNWKSHAQVKNLLYTVMKLPPQKTRGANGVWDVTTNREALEKLQKYLIARPVVNHMLHLRDIGKAIESLEKKLDDDLRIRTSINIAGTNTGRLSSSASDFGTGGNLQNVDRRYREIFIADKGFKLGNCDLEQADSRNLGAFCWEAFYDKHGPEFAGSYLNACESGDLHTFVSRMARPELPWTNDPKENRKLADTIYHHNNSYRDLDKKLGHGTNYVAKPRTAAQHAQITIREAETFQRNYFKAFGCIKEYHELVKKQLKTEQKIITLFGRERHFWGRPADDKTLRDAVVFGPQSSTAEEINIGLLNTWRTHKVQLLIQVHDSILFQYPEELEQQIIPFVLEKLIVPLTLKGNHTFHVPVECQIGWNWGKASATNPNGFIKWNGKDNRVRQ